MQVKEDWQYLSKKHLKFLCVKEILLFKYSLVLHSYRIKKPQFKRKKKDRNPILFKIKAINILFYAYIHKNNESLKSNIFLMY